MSDARARMLDATLELIGEQGVGGVTNRAVAARAGVSPGSLSYHFPSQTELLREALMRFVSGEAERLEALADGSAELDPLAAAVQEIVEGADRRAVLAQMELYLQAGRDPELQAVAARAFAAYDGAARRMLEALGVADPEPLVPALIALVDGYELRRLVSGADAGPGAGRALVEGLAALVRAAA
ncbi:MAG TPA: TetR family transcriptional regulator [Baekduia sp.]|uniref:TetR/AcrR family transcriptional regulator n=1 Tax=Baekduia sp. TaxID=2600305 RepID=UPI002D79F8B1|nr:TetR family transcriptional regulator [Baekduia sp.]HET6510139.1 TetR family transcriptional regulator [Baekduia sp.]